PSTKRNGGRSVFFKRVLFQRDAQPDVQTRHSARSFPPERKKRQRTPTPQAKCGLQIHRKHEIGRNKGPRSRVSPSAAEDISSRVTFQDELDFTVRIEPSHLVTFDHDGRGDPR